MRTVIYDLLAVVGLGLLTGGAWLIYPPSALIASGLALLSLGLYGAKRWAS